VLPVRNLVLYPFVLMPVSLGRPASVKAVEAALQREDKLIAVFSQKDASTEQPGPDDLYEVGTRALIRRTARRRSS
jgi:ATP-dependent Lon protease